MSTRLKSGAAAVALTLLGAPMAHGKDYFVYIASGEDGVHMLTFDSVTGETGPMTHTAQRDSGIGFFEFSPGRRFLYGTGRVPGKSGPAGAAVAYAIDEKSGALTYINETPAKGGSSHINIDATGKMAVVANYGGGSVVSMPLKRDGTLEPVASYHLLSGSSVHPTRQKEAHPHSAVFTPDNKYVVVPDLGQDRLFIYKARPKTGKLLPHDVPYFAMTPGSGPRHMTFHPTRPLAFVINELASTLAMLAYDGGAGSFSLLQSESTLPADYKEQSTTAEVLVHPNGGFVYASNRGHNSIAVFQLDAAAPRLRILERVPTGGDHPRNFRLSPDGAFLFVANMRSNNVVLFRINGDTGRLTPTGTVLEAPRPMCIRFLKR